VSRAGRFDDLPAPPPAPDSLYVGAAVLPDSFWESRAALAHVRVAARARRLPPDAVLGATFAQLCASTSHRIVLPPPPRTAPLNVDIVLLGAAGAGKGGSMDCAAALLADVSDGTAHRWRTIGAGSGEGIRKAFYKRTSDRGVPWERAWDGLLVRVDEGSLLHALASSDRSTTLEVLRQTYSGEPLAFAYSSRDANVPDVPALSYRVAVVVSVQPALAGPLANDTDSGSAQRWLWLATTDPGVPERAPAWPGPLNITLPSPASLRSCDVAGLRLAAMAVAPAIAAEIDAARVVRLQANGNADPDEGHAHLGRLKIGALLALLDGRADITPDDWQLADMIVSTSAGVRDYARQAVARDASTRERHSRERHARAEVAASEAIEASKVERVAIKLASRVHAAEPGSLTVAALRRSYSSWRDVLDDALDHAAAEGWVDVVPEPTGAGGSDRRSLIPGRSRPT
jgi:hypothetical protein